MQSLKILTTGMHDKPFMRRVAKDFPKALLGLPWRIDYNLRVPASTDLQIHAGSGTVTLSGVEGAIVVTAPQSDATLTLLGGLFASTVAIGKVNVTKECASREDMTVPNIASRCRLASLSKSTPRLPRFG